MKTDKNKLFWVFHEKAHYLAGLRETVEENRADWEAYLKGVGCRIVMTPGGLLPIRSPHLVHVVDPWESPGREWHIQVPKDVALRILAIGLP